jgi:hypothetical protein
MTDARVVATGIAIAGEAVDTGVGETTGVTVGDAGDGRCGVAIVDALAE